MTANINLLPDLKSDEKKKKESIKKINKIALAIMAVFVLASVGVFAFSTILGNNLKNLDKDITTQEKLIGDEEEVETLLVGLQSHLNSISSILGKRKKYSVFLTNFSQNVPQTISLNNITISDSLVTIIGEAPSYEKLAGFVLVLSGDSETNADGTVEATATTSMYEKVTLVSVSRNEEGDDVRFTISFVPKEGAFNE